MEEQAKEATPKSKPSSSATVPRPADQKEAEERRTSLERVKAPAFGRGKTDKDFSPCSSDAETDVSIDENEVMAKLEKMVLDEETQEVGEEEDVLSESDDGEQEEEASDGEFDETYPEDHSRPERVQWKTLARSIVENPEVLADFYRQVNLEEKPPRRATGSSEWGEGSEEGAWGEMAEGGSEEYDEEHLGDLEERLLRASVFSAARQGPEELSEEEEDEGSITEQQTE